MSNLERFVEAHFLGIELSESPKQVKLLFREPGGRRFFLEGLRLHRLVVSEFRETNIVDRLSLWDSTADVENYRDALCELVSGQSDRTSADWDQLVEAEAKSIRDGTKLFVTIEAIYGAQALMLAEQIVLIE